MRAKEPCRALRAPLFHILGTTIAKAQSHLSFISIFAREDFLLTVEKVKKGEGEGGHREEEEHDHGEI